MFNSEIISIRNIVQLFHVFFLNWDTAIIFVPSITLTEINKNICLKAHFIFHSLNCK